MLSTSEPNTELAVVPKKGLQTDFGLSSVDSDPSVPYSAFSKKRILMSWKHVF